VLLDAEARAQGDQELLKVTFTRTHMWFWGSSQTDRALAVVESAAGQLRESESHQALRITKGWIRVMSGQPAEGLALLDKPCSAGSGRASRRGRDLGETSLRHPPQTR
jgi:hypothetical protein